MQIVASLEEKEWRTFLGRAPAANIFHSPEMYKVFELARGYQPSLYAAIDDEGQVQALLVSVQVNLSNGLLRRLTARSIAYGGVVCADSPAGRAGLKLMLDTCTENAGRKVLFIELRNLSDTSTLQPVLSGCGFAFEDHLNYLIDLRGSPEDILTRIGSRTRKHIRQSLRKGIVQVEQFDDEALLPVWYGLVQKSYDAARVPLSDPTLFEAAFTLLRPQGIAQFWLARIGNIPVAASIELRFKDTLYGWYSGVDRTYSNESPGELLMWKVLECACLSGLKVYDFGGAGRPDEEYGVRDFKAKFGGRLVNYGRHIQVTSPYLFLFAKWGYKLYRRVRALRV